jgi:hypothetical protein
VCDLHVGRFVFVKDNTNITFVVLADDINPRVVMSVVIGDSFDIHVNVFGKPLNPDHDLWTHVRSKCDSRSSIAGLLEVYWTYFQMPSFVAVQKKWTYVLLRLVMSVLLHPRNAN